MLFSVDELAKTTAQVMYGADSPVTITRDGSGVRVLNISGFEWAESSTGGNLSVTFGGDQPHENRQPYQTVYIFKRTA